MHDTVPQICPRGISLYEFSIVVPRRYLYIVRIETVGEGEIAQAVCYCLRGYVSCNKVVLISPIVVGVGVLLICSRPAVSNIAIAHLTVDVPVWLDIPHLCLRDSAVGDMLLHIAYRGYVILGY